MNIYKQKLEALLDEFLLTEQISKESAKPVELDQSAIGRLSRMDALQAQAMSIESNRRREEKIKRIKAALLRIENEEYGNCLTCDEEIEPRRLEFDPSISLCIICATKLEQKL